MQQYSSLPEQNSQIDATPTLLKKIQQLRAELWLESSLNQLQSHLNDYLLSVCTTVPQPEGTEAEVCQILVNALQSALNTSRVAMVLVQAKERVGRVCYLSRSPSRICQDSFLEVNLKTGKQLSLRLQEVIAVEDLQHLENQHPPIAWRLVDHADGLLGWLIIPVASLRSDCDLIKASPDQRAELITRASQQFAVTLEQLRKIQSCQQQSQTLASSNQELERTNQLKNQFLANTSHEIRTPLSSIIGFTHLLLAQGYDPAKERHQEYLNIIQSSGKHLLALINDILDLSKIEANQLEVQWETVNVPALCRNVLALVKEKAANKGLKLLLDIDPNVTNLVADPLRLKQMLLNLLFNALKFTNTGTVGLKVFGIGEFVHFTVWDTGAGISKEDQAQLFQPYFQIANPHTSREEGTGLGLAVTLKLAQIHGGYVEVESEIDRGSKFIIVLPLTPMAAVGENEPDQPDSEVTPSSSSSPVPITPSSSREILLLEDDVPNAKMMEVYLGRLGYQVTLVENAAKMWEVLTKLVPAVILIDVHLPDENGLDLVQQLRENQQYRMIPIIAQTAMAMKGDREICLAAGVNDYICKPIDLPLLGNLLAKYSQPVT
ncbi:MAG: hybrid histidine kinase/response regulator HrmK [Gloeotrichia echinulata HAB0833]